jgi:hypothetical protein
VFRGLSHKAQVVQLYLWGLQFTDIESRTRHSEGSIKRYLADFRQIAALYARGARCQRRSKTDPLAPVES